MLVPGQTIPNENGGSPTSSNSSATSAASSTTSAASNGGGGGGLSGGAIAGIVIGAVVFIAILVVLFLVLGRKRAYSRSEHTEQRSLFNSIGSAFDNRRSDLDSNYGTAPGADFTSARGPEPAMREFSTAPESASGFGGSSSRYNSGQWNSDNTQQASRTARRPMELDDDAAVYELPESRGP